MYVHKVLSRCLNFQGYSSFLSITMPKTQRPRRSPRPQRPKLPCFIPEVYNLDMPIADEHACKDPDVDDSANYEEKALELSAKKLLPSFDVQADNYYQWAEFVSLFSLFIFMLTTISSWGQSCNIQRLGLGLASGEFYSPPLCHHAANRSRDTAWCEMSVVRRHRDDLNADTDVVGYLTPMSHRCISRASFFFGSLPAEI